MGLWDFRPGLTKTVVHTHIRKQNLVKFLYINCINSENECTDQCLCFLISKILFSRDMAHFIHAFILHFFQCGYGERIQSLARSAETITNTYTQLHSVLENLHLNHITGKGSL